MTDSIYHSAITTSDRVSWRIDDILPDGATFDFAQPFLPETLVDAEALDILSPEERLMLNHIRARGYLGIFGLVEEAILPFVLGQARVEGGSVDDRLRALVRFADEEAKHIALFRRFADVFERGFGTPLALIGPASAVVARMLGRSELGAALMILHIEWMTQRHYIEQVQQGPDVEPHFRSLLRHHWIEESQHALLDEEVVRELAKVATDAERVQALEDYLELVAFFDEAFSEQVVFDLQGLEEASGRQLSRAERAVFVDVQHRSQRRVFLLTGLTHPRVRAALLAVVPDCADVLDQRVAALT